ncbi:ankyrin repeat domain-containing protein [Nocardioides ferulae]|uniref:ankyrin repeat domain-containing protein n=1 Tax=Nocardioides ferulae TaxID=2340821 RepID=UPI000EAD564C|nr:ankyrin repeat domain-containing protein [Nocardioides ferulae]
MAAGDWKDMFLAACAGDVPLVRHHLEHGVDPDHVHPEFQSTALVACLLAGQAGAAEALLDHGADPLLVSPLEALTPVQAAHQAGAAAVVARLVAAGAPTPTPSTTTSRRGGRFARIRRAS